MRKPLHVLLLVLLPLVSTAQTEGEITGTWKVDITETVNLMEADTKARYEGMQPEAQGRAHQSMEDRYFVFKGDGEFEARWKNNGTGKSATGSWSLAGEKLTITIEGQATEYTVEMSADNVLIVKNSKGHGLFHDLYLERQ